MALVRCPECGRRNVSDTAESCPGCGYNVKAYCDKAREEEAKKKAAEEAKGKQEEAEKQKQYELKKLAGIEMPSKPGIPLYGALGSFALFALAVANLIGRLKWANDQLMSTMFFIWIFIWGVVAVLAMLATISSQKKAIADYELAQTDFEAYKIMRVKEIIEAEGKKYMGYAESYKGDENAENAVDSDDDRS